MDGEELEREEGCMEVVEISVQEEEIQNHQLLLPQPLAGVAGEQAHYITLLPPPLTLSPQAPHSPEGGSEAAATEGAQGGSTHQHPTPPHISPPKDGQEGSVGGAKDGAGGGPEALEGPFTKDGAGGGQGPVDEPLTTEGAVEGPLTKDGAVEGPLTKDGAGGGQGPVDEPLTTEGVVEGPLTKDGAGGGPLTKDGAGGGPLTKDGAGAKDGAGEGPLTTDGAGAKGGAKDGDKDGSDGVPELIKEIEVIDLEKEEAEALKGAGLRRRSGKTLDKRFKFCPSCGNMLEAKSANKGSVSWRRKCRACPYIQPIKRRHRYKAYIFPEDEDECQIIETSKADEHRQRTEVFCPKCNHKEAFFYQMQTRSADEPMTTFYECVSKTCKFNWRD